MYFSSSAALDTADFFSLAGGFFISNPFPASLVSAYRGFNGSRLQKRRFISLVPGITLIGIKDRGLKLQNSKTRCTPLFSL